MPAWNQLLTPVCHMMGKLKHLVTLQSVSMHVLLMQQSQMLPATCNGRREWFPPFGSRWNFAWSGGSCPCMLCVSIWHGQRGSLGDGAAAKWRRHLASHLFPEHDQARELLLLVEPVCQWFLIKRVCQEHWVICWKVHEMQCFTEF